MIKNTIGRYVNYPLFCLILMKIEFSRHIFKKFSTLNLIKILSLLAELFHEDGRTDMTKVIVAFRNFAKAPKTEFIWKIG